MGFAKRVGVLAGLGAILVIPPKCEAKMRPDWSQVEGIETARRVRIVLYDDEAPQGMRKFSGRFEAWRSSSHLHGESRR